MLGTLICAVIGALLGFWIGHSIYTDKGHEESILAFREYIKSRKSIKKGKGDPNVDSVLQQSLNLKVKSLVRGEALKYSIEKGDYAEIK